jgi:hypothetical protein
MIGAASQNRWAQQEMEPNMVFGCADLAADYQMIA